MINTDGDTRTDCCTRRIGKKCVSSSAIRTARLVELFPLQSIRSVARRRACMFHDIVDCTHCRGNIFLALRTRSTHFIEMEFKVASLMANGAYTCGAYTYTRARVPTRCLITPARQKSRTQLADYAWIRNSRFRPSRATKAALRNLHIR